MIPLLQRSSDYSGISCEMTSEAMLQPMEESDLRSVVAIEQRVMSFGWKLNTFQPCLYNDAYECWKLKTDEGLIGYCILYFVGKSAQLLNLCVDLPFQGYGYGKQILNFVLARCREKNMRDLFLEVRASNSVAQHLYRGMGFQKIDRRYNYYESVQGREHADVFALELNE